MEARYVKLHCRYDERNADASVNDVSTFRNTARAIVTVGYYETNRREVYGYDAQGNRESVETRLGGRTETAGYDYYPNSDRVKTSGTRAYVYDANGNMTERGTALSFTGDAPDYAADDYYRQFEYDLQNRLTKVYGYRDGQLVLLASYQYANDNLRLSKTANGNTTRYVHGADGYELYRSTSAGDSISTVWLFGRKLAEIEKVGAAETWTYLHTDHLGTVIAATDEAGKTVWLGDATAFGVATADTGLESRQASYTGKDYDSEAGLHYFNARWYDAELGRFTTEDPARDDLNWYVYCGNSPLINTDPDGLEEVLFNNQLGPIPTIKAIETGDKWFNKAIDTVGAGLAGIWNWGANTANMALNTVSGVTGVAQEGYENLDAATGGELSYIVEPLLLYSGTAEGVAALKGVQTAFEAAKAIKAIKAAGKGGSQAFDSFSAFKRTMGKAGDGMEWHHIVEQNPTNAAQFGQRALQTTDNLLPLDATIHRQISGFYSSKPAFTGGQTVRQWLSAQSFEAQTQFGLETLQRFGVAP